MRARKIKTVYGYKKRPLREQRPFFKEICGLPAAGRGATFFGLIDAQGAAAKVNAVQGFNGLVGVGFVHFNKTEATGAASFAIHDELDGKGFAVGGEQGFNAFLGGGKRQIADINGNSITTPLLRWVNFPLEALPTQSLWQKEILHPMNKGEQYC